MGYRYFFKILFCIDIFYICNISAWHRLTISPANMAKVARKIPKDLCFICMKLFFITTMQKFTQKKPMTMTLPNSQVPNSTLGTTKNPTMKQGISFSFHKFWTNRAKVIQFKVIIVLRIFEVLTMIFSQINLAKFHMNFGVKPLTVLRQKLLSFNHIHGSITNHLNSISVALLLGRWRESWPSSFAELIL